MISRFENGSWNRIFTSAGTGNGKIAVAADNQSFYTAFDEGDRLTAKGSRANLLQIWELSLED